MRDEPTIREYKTSDKDAILNLLRLNTPEYFSSEEESDLGHYLDNEIECYFVIEVNNKLVGSGGFNFSDLKTTGIISWDIVHPDFQGKSLGGTLLNYRIEKLKQVKEVQKIIVRTSQSAYRFYEKFGFILLETVEDYWAKDYHLYKMEYVDQY